MKKRSAMGIVVIMLLFGVGSVSAEIIMDRDAVPIPDFPTIALVIAFFVGILGAALFMLRTKKN